MTKNRYDLIGLGYCGLDYSCLTPRIPTDDKVEAQETLTQGGGPAATATVAAARLGLRTGFLGGVGDDERGSAILAAFAHEGVDIAGMVRRTGAESPAAFCWTDSSNGHRSIVWTRGSVLPLTPEEVAPARIESARLLHLDGHQTAAALRAAQIARAAGVTVALDAGTIVPEIDRLLALCDIIIASEKFMERHIGTEDPEDAVRKLFQAGCAGCKFSAVTLGSRGSVGFDGQRLYRQPAFSVPVVDTTGAGDVFHGAFACGFLRGGDWAECLRFAAAAAAIKCTKFGGRTGIPTLAQTEQFMREQGK